MNTRARSAWFVAIMATIPMFGCDTPTASRPVASYDPTTLTNGLLYRWASGTTVRVWVVGGTTGSPFDLGLAVRQAMTSWNDARQFREYTLENAASPADAHIVVFDRETASPVRDGSCPFDPRNSAGYTYFCTGTGSPLRAERLGLNSGGTAAVSVVIRVDRGRVSSQAAYNAVVAHEFGHALGIGAHSDQATDLMFGLPTVAAPSDRDRATLRFVLGQPAELTL